jgi:hypothetical protein
VRAQHRDQEEGLARGGIGLHLRAAGQQDQRLADDLEQVIGGQDEEDGRHQDQRGPRLTRPDLRKGTQQALRQPRRTRLGAHASPTNHACPSMRARSSAKLYVTPPPAARRVRSAAAIDCQLTGANHSGTRGGARRACSRG